MSYNGNFSFCISPGDFAGVDRTDLRSCGNRSRERGRRGYLTTRKKIRRSYKTHDILGRNVNFQLKRETYAELDIVVVVLVVDGDTVELRWLILVFGQVKTGIFR
jgi:hypothetical protein